MTAQCHHDTQLGMTSWLHKSARNLTPEAAPKAVTKAVNRYRHWKPLDSAKHDYQTPHDIAAALHATWRERLIAALPPGLLNQLLKPNCKISRLQNIRNTLNWVCQKTGYDKPSDKEDL